MENRTTFIIAHRIQSVMVADLILVLDKGEVVQMGTHEELVTQRTACTAGSTISRRASMKSWNWRREMRKDEG
jgi:ABC-type protease/lipase transport system fused ATPase/permease subunit